MDIDPRMTNPYDEYMVVALSKMANHRMGNEAETQIVFGQGRARVSPLDPRTATAEQVRSRIDHLVFFLNSPPVRKPMQVWDEGARIMRENWERVTLHPAYTVTRERKEPLAIPARLRPFYEGMEHVPTALEPDDPAWVTMSATNLLVEPEEPPDEPTEPTDPEPGEEGSDEATRAAARQIRRAATPKMHPLDRPAEPVLVQSA